MTELIGKERRTTKDGGTAYILHFIETMETMSGTRIGHRAFSEYLKGDYGYIAIGQSVHLIYRKGFQDKAYLADVHPIEV